MKNSNTKTYNKSNASMMLCYTVIIALTASLVLSVDAIRCHQCNSHLDEDCIKLRLNTPHAPRDTQYLKECEGEGNAFCRKTVLLVESSKERRIVRSCGWVDTEIGIKNSTCFDADNEGYFQTICACHHDGCNTATGQQSSLAVVSLTGICILVATLLRQSA